MECPILSLGVVGRNPGRASGRGQEAGPSPPIARRSTSMRGPGRDPAGRASIQDGELPPRSPASGTARRVPARSRESRRSDDFARSDAPRGVGHDGIRWQGAHAGPHFFRHSAVADGPAPPGGPIQPGMMGGPGAGGPMAGRRFPNVKSQIVFFGPGGPGGTGDMKIGWQTGGPSGEKVYLPGRSTPFRYNFMQGYIYRLKLADISGRPTLTLYPTIEVAPSTPATDAYLTHNQIPVQFTAEDLDQVEGGNFVTKVIYLPDPRYQELAVANVETLVSTRLEPGVDPVLEADKRGTILLIVRLGGINLEMDAGRLAGPVRRPR